MEGIYTEFENENELRAYPFAGGCDDSESENKIPIGLFVDAILYPINPSGLIYISSISEDGTFSISDDSGVIMTGTPNGKLVELYDISDFHRHTGTLIASSDDALEEFAGRGYAREFPASYTTFASSCVFPITIDGVISLSIGDAGTATGDVIISNKDDDVVRVSSGTSRGKSTLRFDIVPSLKVPDESFIKRIICVVDGQTPFRIEKSPLAYNAVQLWLDCIDRETVCAAAHRENAFEMCDTCAQEQEDPIEPDQIPEAYKLIEVYIPPDENQREGGIASGAANAFYLVVPNMLGHVNPLSITMEDGVVSPKLSNPDVDVDGMEANLTDGAMLDSMTSKGVVLQVPGLSGGLI